MLFEWILPEESSSAWNQSKCHYNLSDGDNIFTVLCYTCKLEQHCMPIAFTLRRHGDIDRSTDETRKRRVLFVLRSLSSVNMYWTLEPQSNLHPSLRAEASNVSILRKDREPGQRTEVRDVIWWFNSRRFSDSCDLIRPEKVAVILSMQATAMQPHGLWMAVYFCACQLTRFSETESQIWNKW